jgi:hypothetical protein
MLSTEYAGQKGATRLSWSQFGPRDLLAQLADEHPKASRERLRQLFSDAVRADDRWLDGCVEYAFTNSINALENQRVRDARQPAARPSDVAKKMVPEAMKVLLLNMEMPNGKRLRYCTGREVAKFGSFYTKIAKKAGAKRIGEVYDEAQLRAALGGSDEGQGVSEAGNIGNPR